MVDSPVSAAAEEDADQRADIGLDLLRESFYGCYS
jgi:hypothetical protein